MGDVRDLPLEAGPLTRHLLARTRHQGLEQITRGALRAAPALLQPLPKTAPGSVLLPPVAPLGLVPLPLWRQPQDPLLALATQPVLAPAPGPAAYQSTAVSRAPAARSAPPEPAVQPSAAAKEPVALSRPSHLGYRPSTEVISEEPEEASVQHTAASEPQQVLSSSTADTKPGKEQAPAEDKEPVEEQERQPDAVNCEPASPECSSTSTFVCDLERSVNLSHSSFDPSSATNTRPGSPAVRYRTLKQVESENYSDSDDILRESVLLKLCSNMSSANSSPARSRAGVLGTAHLVDDAADHSKDAGIMPSVSPMPKLQMQRPPPLQVAASAPVDALGPLALKLQAQRQVIRPIVAAPVLHAQGVSQVASSGGSSGGGADQSDQNSKGARSGITALFAKKKKDAGPVKTSSDVMNGLTAADQLGPLQRGMAKLAVRPVDGSGALSQASAESVYATPVKEASNAGSASADSMSGTAMAYDSHASGKSGQQPMPDLAPSLPQSHGSSQASSGMPAPGHPHLAGGHLSRMGETMRAIEMGQGPLAKAMSRGRVGMAADVHKQPMPAKSGVGSTFTFDQLLPSADPLAYGAPSAYITEEPPAALMPVSSAGIASNLIPPAAELGNLLPKSKSKKLPTMPAFLKQAVHQKQEQHRPDAQQEQQAGGTAPAGSTPAGGLACILESDEVGPQSQIAAAVSQMRLTAESSGASEPVSPRHTAQRPLRQQHQLHVPVQPSEDSAAELYAARAGFNFRTMPNANTTAVAAMTHSIAGTGVSAPPIHAAPIHVAHVYTAPVLATTVHEVQQAPRSTVAERALAFQQQMQSASQTPPQQRGRQAVEQAAGSASKKVAFAGAAGGPTVVWQSPFGAAEHVAPVASPGMAPGAVSKGNSVSAGGADTSSQTAANAAVLEAAETAARSLSMPGMHMQVGSTSPAPAQTKGQGLPPLSPGMASAVTGPQQSFMTAVSSAASSHPADDGVDSRAQPGAGTRVQVGDAQAKRDPSPLARSVSIPGISPAIMAALKRTVTIQKQEAAVPAAEPAAQPPSMPVMAAPYGPPEPAMAVSAQTSLQPHALSFKGASQAMSTGHTSSSNGSEVVSAPRAGAVGTPPGVSSAWYAGVQHPGVNEAEPAARPGHVEAGVQRAPGWRAAPMSFADAAAARAAERLARVEQEASVSVNLPAAAKPPKPTPHAGMLPLPPAAVPPPGSRTPPPPPPPGPPPPPPLVTGFSAAPVLPKSRASTSTATQSSENGAASVASSVSVASSGAMADVLSMIKALGEGGQHKGHLRSLSKSKAKRGTKGQQVATAAAAPKVPAGSPLGGLGALGAATAAAAQVRGSMQAHALLQRVRSSMRVQDEDSSDDEYFG